MKVGVVTTSYPRFTDDPAGNFVGEHVAALRALGHEVEVIAADDEIGREHRRDDAVRVAGSGLFYRGGAPDLLEQRTLRGAMAAATFTARLTAVVARRALRWDSIVAHWLAPSALACLPARAPLLAIAHGGDVHTLRRTRLLVPALYALLLRGAQLVFVSEELRELAVREASVDPLSTSIAPWVATARVQPMGIDVARFAAIPRTPTEPPTIAIVSRLVPIKGIDVAIAALAHLQHRVRLVIAGDGPELGALTVAARAATNVDRGEHIVELLGAADTRARDRLLATASIVLVPSRVVGGRSEGTPLIALEALAAGVPVIASAVGGLRSLRGVELVPPDDPRALAIAIDRMLDAPPSTRELRDHVVHLDWREVAATLVRNP